MIANAVFIAAMRSSKDRMSTSLKNWDIVSLSKLPPIVVEDESATFTIGWMEYNHNRGHEIALWNEVVTQNRIYLAAH